MREEKIYFHIKNTVKKAAEKILSGSSLDSFLKLDLKDQLLGLKIFAYTSSDFDFVTNIKRLENLLSSLPTDSTQITEE